MEKTNERFTIGWIAPLALEKEAAKLVLDEEYPQEEVRDENAFYLGGRIGEHDVVIGVQSQTGLEGATALAKKMQAGFPNIKYFIVVGIGGGVPQYGPAGAERTIVLGDVVVSTGIVPYDKGAWVGEGKLAYGGQSMEVTGDLMHAVKNFRGDNWGGSEVRKVLDQMRQKLDDERWNQYDQPNPNTDRLFDAAYSHKRIAAEDCARYCDPKFATPRTRRGDGAARERDEPAVHFGNMASSNQLQISAKKRDEIQKEHNIICFEMEAAGVMHEQKYPCVVVRGICDYADSHKNKGWQNYAAATAAAYAKGLLSKIPSVSKAASSAATSVTATFGMYNTGYQAGLVQGGDFRGMQFGNMSFGK